MSNTSDPIANCNSVAPRVLKVVHEGGPTGVRENVILIKIQAKCQLKEVDRVTEKSHVIVYTANPAHPELHFSEASVQRGE